MVVSHTKFNYSDFSVAVFCCHESKQLPLVAIDDMGHIIDMRVIILLFYFLSSLLSMIMKKTETERRGFVFLQFLKVLYSTKQVKAQYLYK